MEVLQSWRPVGRHLELVQGRIAFLRICNPVTQTRMYAPPTRAGALQRLAPSIHRAHFLRAGALTAPARGPSDPGQTRISIRNESTFYDPGHYMTYSHTSFTVRGQRPPSFYCI